MNPILTQTMVNQLRIYQLENDFLVVKVVPEAGGKIISVYHKKLGHEFLWKNPALSLQAYPAGTEYDPHFYGGIDELLPNDLPERIQGIDYPDHGELWTTSLTATIDNGAIRLQGKLPLSGLLYQKMVSLDAEAPLFHTDYRIENLTSQTRQFLWKLHAALAIGPGDRLQAFALTGQVVDPQYSRFSSTEPFNWPIINGIDAGVVPERNGMMDFFYLSALYKGEMNWISAHNERLFSYRFDPNVFPYGWYFASYGGFLDHYTAVLEPCTAMPISVNEAAAQGQCSRLEPGQVLQTRVSVFAGNYTPQNA